MLGFDSCSGRYKIDVDGFGPKRIKRCNLLIEKDVEDYDGDVEGVNAFDVSELSLGPCDLDIFPQWLQECHPTTSLSVCSDMQTVHEKYI